MKWKNVIHTDRQIDLILRKGWLSVGFMNRKGDMSLAAAIAFKQAYWTYR